LKEKNPLKEKELSFLPQLGIIIHVKAYDEILHIDGTTFNLWQKLSRCCVTFDLKLFLIKALGLKIIIIGAISKERGLVHFEVFFENINSNIMHALKKKYEER
jgi:hypothetical protein